MKPADRILSLLKILQEESHKGSILSMPEIQALLEEKGYPSDRRTLYSDIDSLMKHGFPIIYTRKGKQGYYYIHPLSEAEILLLDAAIDTTVSLSSQESKELKNKIHSFMNPNTSFQFPYNSTNETIKTDNKMVLRHIELLLEAIKKGQYVSFTYYDTTITFEKKYRRAKQKYKFIPYSIVSNNGRYYCIFYSEKHETFSPYRIDKMESVTLEEIGHTKPFNLKTWLSSSFQMYKATPQTITLRCKMNLSNILFDQFGKNMIISEVKEEDFVVNIRASLTPTLETWLLQFEDSITVLHPKELIDDYLSLAESLKKKYKKK
ncbi:MAG: WYL domain-containing protein [Solobacterium sp.]|nr:WYL domain-containing protein [Solobacterium sp.]